MKLGLRLRPWRKSSMLLFFEKLGFDNWEISKLGTSWKLWMIRNLTIGWISWFSSQISPYDCEVFGSRHDGWNQASSCCKKWLSRSINNNRTFRKFPTIRIMKQDSKPLIFWWNTLVCLQEFWLRSNWNYWALYFCREKSCVLKEIQY